MFKHGLLTSSKALDVLGFRLWRQLPLRWIAAPSTPFLTSNCSAPATPPSRGPTKTVSGTRQDGNMPALPPVTGQARDRFNRGTTGGLAAALPQPTAPPC